MNKTLFNQKLQIGEITNTGELHYCTQNISKHRTILLEKNELSQNQWSYLVTRLRFNRSGCIHTNIFSTISNGFCNYKMCIVLISTIIFS
jgi:hypothetical protein